MVYPIEPKLIIIKPKTCYNSKISKSVCNNNLIYCLYLLQVYGKIICIYWLSDVYNSSEFSRREKKLKDKKYKNKVFWVIYHESEKQAHGSTL